MRSLHRKLAILVVACLPFYLSACDSSGEGAEPATPDQWSLNVTVDGCENTSVKDSGHVLYIVLSASCSAVQQIYSVRIDQISQRSGAKPGGLRVSLEANESAIATTLINGIGNRALELVRQASWRKVSHKGAWTGRDGAGLLNLNGKLYMLGGWLYGPTTNEVWTTSDLVNWTFVGFAPWPGRHGAAWLVHNNRMYVIGGDLNEDVWSSANGVDWIQHTPKAPIGERYTPNAASINGELIVYSGQDWGPVQWCNERPDCVARGNRSVWKSRDGAEWTKILSEAPWGERALIHGSMVFDNYIYLLGGGLKVAPPNARYAETLIEQNDIWRSRNGVQWEQVSDDFGFKPRTHFSVVVTHAGCFVSDGSVGSQNNLSNELFHAPDCITYKAIPVPAEAPLRHASSLVDFNGSLVLIGGPREDGAGTSVWQYFY